MAMMTEKQGDAQYFWNNTPEKGDYEAVEALISMSCNWKTDLKKHADMRPITPASDMSEDSDETLLPGVADFSTIPAFVSAYHVQARFSVSVRQQSVTRGSRLLNVPLISPLPAVPDPSVQPIRPGVVPHHPHTSRRG